MSTSSVTPAQPTYSRTVQYPDQSVVAFPDSLSHEDFQDAAASAWQQLSSTSAGRFTKGAYSTTLEPLGDLAHKYWHDVTTPANATGDNFISDLAASIAAGHVDQAHKAIDAFHEGRYTEAAGHAMGAAVPLVGPAAAQAGEAIGKGDVAGGLGQGAGLLGATLLGGKAAEGTEEAEAAAAKPASLKPIAAPAAGEVKPVASMTPTERAAAAYTHKAFGPDTADVELLGHQGTETSTSELKHGTSMEHEEQAAATNEDVNQYIQQLNDQGIKFDEPASFSLGKARNMGKGVIEHPILDKEGNPAGVLNVTIDGKNAKINFVGSPDMNSQALSGKIGLRGLKNLQEEFISEHPSVESFSGKRIGGARGNAMRDVTVPAKKPVAPSKPAPVSEDISHEWQQHAINALSKELQ